MRKIFSCLLLALAACIFACAAAPQPAPAVTETQPPAKGGITRDPIENDPQYKQVFETIDDEVKAALKNDPMYRRRGGVHIFWSTKKGILKQKYGIDWRSPADMNPHIIFD